MKIIVLHTICHFYAFNMAKNYIRDMITDSKPQNQYPKFVYNWSIVVTNDAKNN